MNINLSSIIQEAEAIESELHTLITLKDGSDSSGMLAEVCIESIQKRISVISISILNLLVELNSNETLFNESKVSPQDLIATLLTSLLSKLLLKIVGICNNNLQVLAPISNKLQNRDSGLISEFNSISECIDSLISITKLHDN